MMLRVFRERDIRLPRFEGVVVRSLELTCMDKNIARCSELLEAVRSDAVLPFPTNNSLVFVKGACAAPRGHFCGAGEFFHKEQVSPAKNERRSYYACDLLTYLVAFFRLKSGFSPQACDVYVCWSSHIISKSKDQPGKVAHPSRA